MRRRTRRRSGRRPLLYAPVPLAGGRARRSPWRRRVVTVVAMLVVVSAAAAVVAGATSRGHHVSDSRPDPQPPAWAHRAAAGPPRARRATARAAGGVAVDKLIRTTPMVTGGVPRHRVIALTFDDGPSPYTPEIVRELVRLHVPATFFVVGQQLRYFSSGLRDELSHHFEIGDHTENHPWLIRLAPTAQLFQIHAVAAWMERLGAPAPTLFRPPYGAYDHATLAALRAQHMLGVLWSIDPGDWRRPGVGAIASSVISAARPGGIVELHDGGGDRSETAAALPVIVRALRRRHYRLVTVSQLLALDPPSRHQRLPQVGAA
jgi:peptidoglycan/xylan/chitin deacetylase (PgdA/CDA1 family)